MNPKQLGEIGEKIAQDFLKKKGYKILDRNFAPHYISGPKRGEVDLVAKKENIISFVEVKTLWVRPGSDPGFSPEEKVDFSKQRKLIRTSESWLMKKKIPLNSKWQIDVISIKIDKAKKKAKISHFKNAIPSLDI